LFILSIIKKPIFLTVCQPV